MKPFLQVFGAAASLPGANIDTDVIMPKQFLEEAGFQTIYPAAKSSTQGTD